MEKVKIGYVSSFHGIKGEIRILSNFLYKEKVFNVGNKLIIDDKSYEIVSYRKHKNYDMVKFLDFNNINEVLDFLKKDVYFNKEDLKLNEEEVLDEELITYEVLTKDGQRGTIKEIFWASPENKILRIEVEKEILIPMYSPWILKIDKKSKTIYIEIPK